MWKVFNFEKNDTSVNDIEYLENTTVFMQVKSYYFVVFIHRTLKISSCIKLVSGAKKGWGALMSGMQSI